MIKVRHSKQKRVVLLDFSGDIGEGEVRGAVSEVGTAIRGLGNGYTLVEVFRNQAHFTQGGALCAGELAEACYSHGRIWMVVLVESDERCDPGMSILHRTRWKREIPEVKIESVGQAMALAKEEVVEQKDWI